MGLLATTPTIQPEEGIYIRYSALREHRTEGSPASLLGNLGSHHEDHSVR
jgi:hypothetical protein